MKIAVDARPLSNPLSGIGRYTSQILKYLHFLQADLLSDTAFRTQINSDTFFYREIRRYPVPYSLGKLLWQQMQLPYFISRQEPDLFWSPRHHLPLAGCKKIPMILTIHDLVYRKYPKTMKRSNWALEKLLLAASVKRASHIIAVSEATKNDLISGLHTPPEKITVIHSSYFMPENQIDIDLISLGIHKPYILFLGTLEPRKNIERLVDAYLALPENIRHHYQLVLAGGAGWHSNVLRAKIAHVQTNQNIILTGYVNDAAAHTLLKNATCFAFPSLYEGFGLPILEAMHAGCPVLTSQDPACMEVSGGAALCIDPLSLNSITEGLQKILEDSNLRIILRNKGFENIKRFSWQRAAEQHLEVFKRFAT